MTGLKGKHYGMYLGYIMYISNYKMVLRVYALGCISVNRVRMSF